MVKGFEDVQQFGKESMDATLKSFGAFTKNAQAIAIEIADYNKKVFEQGTIAAEKLIGAKSLDKAIEVQSDYVKSSYEGFVAEATKLGEPLCRFGQRGVQALRNPVREIDGDTLTTGIPLGEEPDYRAGSSRLAAVHRCRPSPCR
jgi:hypothetical protein